MRRIILILMICTLIGAGTTQITGFTDDSKDTSSFKSIIVEENDTLWHIASEYSHNETNMRKLIYEIKKINNLNGGTIYPGQELLIPVDSKNSSQVVSK